MANKCQMSSDINILYHSYQELLKHQTFITFLVKFHVSGSIINFPLTGNAKWHILSLFLMPVIQCIIAQLRLVSSESAVSYYCHMCCPMELHGIFYLY